MNILLVYATYSSGTQTASELVEKLLVEKSVEVVRKNIKEVTDEEFNHFDLIILASPSWWNRNSDGMPHEFFLKFMDSIDGRTFPDKHFAIFGLGDEKFTHFCGAVDHLEAFVKKLQGKLVVESLRIDGYFFEPQKNKQKLTDWTKDLVKKLSITK